MIAMIVVALLAQAAAGYPSDRVLCAKMPGCYLGKAEMRPTTCTVGEIYLSSPGSWYACTATNRFIPWAPGTGFLLSLNPVERDAQERQHIEDILLSEAKRRAGLTPPEPGTCPLGMHFWDGSGLRKFVCIAPGGVKIEIAP